MTTPDYRALCAELAERLDRRAMKSRKEIELIDSARAVLPAPDEPISPDLPTLPPGWPPTATSFQTLRPVDRYTLSGYILAAWHKHGNDSWCSIADEVIAALAAPEAVGVAPTDEQLFEVYREVHQYRPDVVCHPIVVQEARAYLARYGTAHPAPVPVGERLPGAGDCDAEGRCWWWDDNDDMWRLNENTIRLLCWTYWLPHWALPLPEATP